MNITQLQYLAKKGGSKKFKVVGPLGAERTGVWLDAWIGFLQMDGVNGAMMVKDFLFEDELNWFPIPEEEKQSENMD